METHLRIIRWHRLLQFTTGMAARSPMLLRFRCFWCTDDQNHSFKKTKFKKSERTDQLKRLTMKIRIRLLRWLSLLQFPAYPGDQACKLTQYALFRRTPVLLPENNRYKTLKNK